MPLFPDTQTAYAATRVENEYIITSVCLSVWQLGKRPRVVKICLIPVCVFVCLPV